MGYLINRLFALVIIWIIFWPATAVSSPIPKGYVSIDAWPCRISVPEQNTGVARELIPTCEKMYVRILSQLGLNRDGNIDTVDVRVVGEPKDIKKVSPNGIAPPSWSHAVAFPQYNMVILPLRNSWGSPVTDLDVVLEHELSHLALRKALNGKNVPRWFSEGVAIQQSEESSYKRYWLLWQAARGDQLAPLSEIEQYPNQPGRVNLAYAEAADFLGFLLRKSGWLGLRIVIREVAKGAPFEEAFQFSYNDSVGNLEKKWLQSLATRWQWLPLLTGTGAVWGFIVALFLLAYTVSKNRQKKRLDEMEQEENRLDQLTELAGHISGTKPKITKLVRIQSKIRIDDDIHTLH